MLARYAGCASYEDQGAVTMISFPDNEAGVTIDFTTFQTVFDRAKGGFYFDFTTSHPYPPVLLRMFPRFAPPLSTRGVIARAHEGPVRRWWTVKPVSTTESLPIAITSFTNVS